MQNARWLIDGNNVFGSKPDGWWNDRPAAMGRFAQAVAVWCRTHDDDVSLVFDAPVPVAVMRCAGGNLAVIEAPRSGRNAADDHIVDLTDQWVDDGVTSIVVITSDRGLRSRLPDSVAVRGSGSFREQIGY